MFFQQFYKNFQTAIFHITSGQLLLKNKTKNIFHSFLLFWNNTKKINSELKVLINYYFLRKRRSQEPLEHLSKEISGTVAQRCSVKKVFLEISQSSQENTCARVSFLIKLKAWGEFCEISKNSFFYRTPPLAASEICKYSYRIVAKLFILDVCRGPGYFSDKEWIASTCKVRSSHRRCSVKKAVLRNFTKFTGKLWHRCFPANFVKFLGKPFLQNTYGRMLL